MIVRLRTFTLMVLTTTDGDHYDDFHWFQTSKSDPLAFMGLMRYIQEASNSE